MAQLKVVSDNTDMPVYEAMCKAIAECHRVDEVSKLQDDILKRILYSQQLNGEAEIKRKVNEIYLRAERRLGELTAKLPKAKTRYDTRLSPRRGDNPGSKQEILKANSITDSRASRAEKIASIPKKEFEKEVKKPKASIRKLIDYAKVREEPRPKKPDPTWRADPNDARTKFEANMKHLDAQVKLTDGLHRVSEGLKQAAWGMKIKDVILELMSDQGTEIPATVNNELRKIKKHLAALSGLWVPLCPCPFRNQKALSVVKDTIDA